MSSARSRSTASTISAAVRPNFERSPADSIHLPAPCAVSLARTPMCGRMPSSRDVLSDEVELAEAVDDDDRRAAEPLREQRGLDVLAVLVAVADDQRAGRVEQRERDQQLGLAAGLEADARTGAPNSTISSTTWRCWFTLIG